PVVLGFVLRRFAGPVVAKALPVLPLVSVIGITGVVVAVVSGSADKLLSVGPVVVLAVVLHNVLGVGLGYVAARVAGIDEAGRRAIALEVGMQNSGLAASLASTYFSPVAALPGAIFSVWHNISGSLVATFWARRPVAVAGDEQSRIASDER
ncbi:bile acid:sodium symporter family protein, partial [Saccharopolyspora sp. NPDC047091]